MLPAGRLEWNQGWGESGGVASYVYRPSTLEEVQKCLQISREEGLPLISRGSGCSYGDAALLPEGMSIHFSRMQRILAWDPNTGIIDVEPGVTLSRLWRYVLGDGWWPPVVTGTMEPTVGGCMAMNVHGKNNWARGTFSEHCLEFDLLQPDGSLRTLQRTEDPDFFNAVAGSFGMLGILTRIRLKMKKVASGLLDVRAISSPDLESMLRMTDEAKDQWEYVVGWIDAFAGGKKLGRGLLHFGRHLDAEEDPHPEQSLRTEYQDLPDELFYILPKSSMWRLLKPWTNKFGMSWINRLKYLAGSTIGNDALYQQSLAEFSFLLDYVPNWKKIYSPGGLIQHQSFVPVDRAEDVFRRQLELCRKRGMPSFLAVLKRHRRDDCLLGHGVDGFSLALDFPVHPQSRDDLWKLVAEMGKMVAEAGGRFYPAKDSALSGDIYRSTFADGQLEKFLSLKEKLDPELRLRSLLAERLLGVS